jgi:hypothetical protein
MAFRTVTPDEIERVAQKKETGIFKRLMNGNLKTPVPVVATEIPIISILDPVIPVMESAPSALPSKRTLQFSFPSLPALPDLKIIPVIKIGVSLLLIWFGITSTGSYYGPITGRFAGILAEIFYQYQAGMVMAMVGLLVIYATLRDH